LLGTNFMWDAQVPSLKNFHLLRYDVRAVTSSSVTPPPYSVPELAADVHNLPIRSQSIVFISAVSPSRNDGISRSPVPSGWVS
jgi:hypothetical protein